MTAVSALTPHTKGASRAELGNQTIKRQRFGWPAGLSMQGTTLHAAQDTWTVVMSAGIFFHCLLAYQLNVNVCELLRACPAAARCLLHMLLS
jgi:hypothetical protein